MSAMEFPLTITPAFLKRSHARRIFRHWLRLVLASVLILIAVGMDVRRGQLGSISAVGLSAIGFCVLVYGATWIRQVMAIREWARRQGTASVVYALSEATVKATSEMGGTELKWEAFSGIVVTDFDTRLVFSRNGALTLPTDQIPPEALDFMKKQLGAHGKKIEDQRKVNS
jgi:hypothetical protein